MKNKKGTKTGGQNGSSKSKAQGKAQIKPEEKILCNHVLPVPTFFFRKSNTDKKSYYICSYVLHPKLYIFV